MGKGVACAVKRYFKSSAISKKRLTSTHLSSFFILQSLPAQATHLCGWAGKGVACAVKVMVVTIERSQFQLNDHFREGLTGTLLGDAYMRRFSINSNSRIIFRQGSINSDYLLHLCDLFKEFTLKSPSVTTIIDKESKKSRSNLSFATITLPWFNEFYELFYVGGRKRIPLNISEYLTRVSLAYWIMDDGGFTGQGLKLYTNAYNVESLPLFI